MNLSFLWNSWVSKRVDQAHEGAGSFDPFSSVPESAPSRGDISDRRRHQVNEALQGIPMAKEIALDHPSQRVSRLRHVPASLVFFALVR